MRKKQVVDEEKVRVVVEMDKEFVKQVDATCKRFGNTRSFVIIRQLEQWLIDTEGFPTGLAKIKRRRANDNHRPTTPAA